jgi:hypothetical protein
MTSQSSGPGDSGILDIRDPQLDAAALWRKVCANAQARKPLPPLDQPFDRSRGIAKRSDALLAIQSLRSAALDSGAVGTSRRGWLGFLDLLAKRAVRKLINGHLLRQQRINTHIAEALDRVIAYLDFLFEDIHSSSENIHRSGYGHPPLRKDAA